MEETLAGRESEIKETPLGVRVFDRGDDFNPRLDPIVRVQARNLRTRIAKYYEGPGADDPIRIEMPKGTYVPVFHGLTEDMLSRDVPAKESVALASSVSVMPPPVMPPPPPVMPPPVMPPPVLPTSVMPVPPPRSPVAERGQGLRPRFLLATVVLVVILAGIALLWITRIYAAPPHRDLNSLGQNLLIRGRDTPRFLSLSDKMNVRG